MICLWYSGANITWYLYRHLLWDKLFTSSFVTRTSCVFSSGCKTSLKLTQEILFPFTKVLLFTPSWTGAFIGASAPIKAPRRLCSRGADAFYPRAGSVGCGIGFWSIWWKRTRKNAGRKEGPSYAIIDFPKRENCCSQWRTRNWRNGKTKGGNRLIVGDAFGNLLSVVVHTTNIHDTKSRILAAKGAHEPYPSIQGFCADAGYQGVPVSDLRQKLDLGADFSEKIKRIEWKKLS